MPAPRRIHSEFEGQTLVTLTHHGRPCWIAQDIGRVLGYSRDGRRLVFKILGQWSADLIEGHDYTVLRGDELQEFRASLLLGASGSRPPRPARRLVLLYEPGLHLVLSLSFKPAGLPLRRFLMDEVLPRMTGKSGAWPRQTPGPVVFAPHRGRALDRQALREQRLLAQHELSRRVFQSESLRRTVQTLAHLGRISDDQAQSYEVLATEIALGIELPGLRVGSPFDDVANQARQRFADDLKRRVQRMVHRSHAGAAEQRGDASCCWSTSPSPDAEPDDLAAYREDDPCGWLRSGHDPAGGSQPDDGADGDLPPDDGAPPDSDPDLIDE